MVCQRRSITCDHMHRSGGDSDQGSRGQAVCVGGRWGLGRIQGIWETSVPAAQFCCVPENALKIVSFFFVLFGVA